MKQVKHFLLFILSVMLIGCDNTSDYDVQGYIEGQYTYVSSSCAGELIKLATQKGSFVKQNQLLFELEPHPESDLYKAALENYRQTIAARNAISANLAYQKVTYERNQILVDKHAIEVSALDNARSVYLAGLAQLAEANANIDSSKAEMEKAKWTFEQKTIVAPIDGFVFDTYYRIGEYTQAMQPILSLLNANDIKVIFYVPEKTLTKIKLGEKVWVNLDDGHSRYQSTISFISPTAEYTPPVIYSNETNSKLIYRVEGRFAIDQAFHLHPGQPVRVTFFSHDR